MRKIKNKFGTYEKTKYELFYGITLIYFFTTTIHSEYDAIAYLKKINKNKILRPLFVYKTCMGQRTLIYKEIYIKRKLTDSKKDFIRKNYRRFYSKDLASKLGLSQSYIYLFRKSENLIKEKNKPLL